MSYQIKFIAGDMEFSANWRDIPPKGSIINLYRNIYDNPEDEIPSRRVEGIYEVVSVHFDAMAIGAACNEFFISSPTVRVFIEAVEDDSELIAYLESPAA